MKTGIFYESTTGNTENAAELIGKLIEDAQVQSIAEVANDQHSNTQPTEQKYYHY